MSTYTIPAPDAPGNEWGRLAVSLPGWRWMSGMLDQKNWRYHAPVPRGRCDAVRPDPDDAGTAGCLLALLAASCWIHRAAVLPRGAAVTVETPDGLTVTGRASTLGRAAIAAAAAIGRWPGGEE